MSLAARLSPQTSGLVARPLQLSPLGLAARAPAQPLQLPPLGLASRPVCDEKPISILETGTRISFFQSHVRDGNENFSLLISCSRWEREFIFLNLVLRDENFIFLISGFETRTRIEIETILARIFGNYIVCFFID